MAVALNPDGTRAVTASKDGTLRLWNLDVRYHMQEDPKLLLKAPLPLPSGRCYRSLHWGPSGMLAGVLPGGEVHFLWASELRLVESLQSHDGEVTALAWAPKVMSFEGEDVAVLATSSNDRRVRLWRSPSP